MIRQPEDVFVRVASPRAPGSREVGPSAALKRSPDCARPEHAQRDRRDDCGRRDGADDDDEATGPWTAARAPLRLDPGPEGGRCFDLRGGRPRERDSPLLLGETVGELCGSRDARLGRRAAFGRERPVRERRELCDLTTAVICFSTMSQ